MSDSDHKTVFLIDHGPAMGESSKQMVEYDIATKSRPQGVVPLAPVAKSLWTSSIEALCEYCRIVWDIFPHNKLLRFVVGDTSARFLNSWNKEEQNLNHLMKSLSGVGPPLKKADGNIMVGLVSAVGAVAQQTSAQKKLLSSGSSVSNRGRIVCITQLKNDVHLKTIVDCACDAVNKHCESASTNEGILPIDSLELVIIHVKPFGSNSAITEHSLTPASKNPKVLVEAQDVKATRHGIAIANRLLHLVQRHFDLSVTSITGIPMKEEQHANSSANYDVLLLHRRLPGTAIRESEHSMWDGELSSTMLLKWGTPKINYNELYHCTGAARVSPVDVNSRPSLCLTNFLLNGRSVSLEHWNNRPDGGTAGSGGSRQMTHMISCRGSDIFLHALGIFRPPFEDPPNISDGPGGKVKDYRISDFGEIIKHNHLLPLGGRVKSGTLPIDGAMAKLDRRTRYWPLVYSKSIIFNLAKTVDPLLEAIVKENLTPDDVLQCQRVIYNLIGLERDGAALPLVTSAGSLSRGINKQSKREEQYKSMWRELEDLLRAHSSTSSKHMDILDCMLECIGKGKSSRTSSSVDKLKSNVRSGANEIYESPESPPPLKKSKTENESSARIRPQKGTQSLLSMWTQRVENTNSQRHVEFYGRLASDGNKAVLYPNFEEDPNNAQNTPANQDRQTPRHGHHRYQGHHRSGTGGGTREEGGRSGRNTPQGSKPKMAKKTQKPYPQ
ncbi:unnamed protein product [Clavelina lepadiformis]|uniref:Protein asunder n=1 Tax=Clavelina lepadiformis TaxID=159417 RepID=A0ABP0GN72_CLALP